MVAKKDIQMEEELRSIRDGGVEAKQINKLQIESETMGQGLLLREGSSIL